VVSLEDLKKEFRGEIRISEPLSKHTWLKVGGPADYYLEPSDPDDVIYVVRFFRKRDFPFMIMGRGSNVLIHDEGYRGAVINLEDVLSGITEEEGVITVEAGAWISAFVDFCIKRGFAGTEMLAGIPGTIGGAVRMNAGAYGGEISDGLIDVDVIRDDKVVRVKKQDGGFVYRGSGFENDVILSARFRFGRQDPEELMQVRRELLIRRNAAQPVNLPNTGSIFKNPEGHFAAALIEKCGLKRKRIGGAMISELHGNFIVNMENASARDVFELMVVARNAVYKQFGILLEHEVLLVGFSREEEDLLRNVPSEITG
jgi:UDP-N-acetylmuramate dehydrogenase